MEKLVISYLLPVNVIRRITKTIVLEFVVQIVWEVFVIANLPNVLPDVKMESGDSTVINNAVVN